MNDVLDIDGLMRQIRTEANLRKAGEEAIAVIKARTLRGEFLEGSSPGAEKYSTTPMPMPFGKWTKETRAKALWRDENGEEEIELFRSKAGMLWVILKGGYKRFRELAGKEVENVTLNWSGQMMKAIQIMSVDEAAGTVTIGFSDYRSGQIADFHRRGAGRSRKKRIFFALSQREQEEIKESVLGNIKLQF